MLPLLTDILKKEFGTEDFLHLDFKSVDEVAQEDLDYTNVRGSVRLIMHRILTPLDVKNLTLAVLRKKLP